MLGDLPPSSSVRRFMLSAALRMISLPTSVDPVNAILSIPGWRTIVLPTSDRPVTMFNTPAGTPASIANSPNRNAVSEVRLGGFQTIGLPQASAGPSFQEANSNGKFHGTMSPTTPTGPRNV